jgi:Tol biopolymer transport system component
MMVRRLLWVVIALLLVAVLVGVGGAAWLLLRDRTVPIRLVAVGPNTQMRLIGEGNDRVLASDASDANELNFAFPAPSPDGRRLAYVTQGASDRAITQLDLATGERRELYRSHNDAPFDLAWSPDGKYLVFLVSHGQSLSLELVPADGSQPAQSIVTGNPSYFVWSPDSATLLVHLSGHSVQNGHLVAYRLDGRHSDTLLNDPGLFQAPAWSYDGSHFFYAAQPPITRAQPQLEDISSNIVRVNADGKEPTTLVVEKQAYLWMVRAPNSDRIAYIARALDESGAAVLKLVDGTSGAVQVLSRTTEHVTAFFWSPDGARIAYLTHEGAYEAAGPRTWHIIEVDGGAVRDFETFQPSGAFVGLQVYFDAYTFSLSPWSPDSSRLAYGAENGVYVLDVAAGSATKAAEGTLGVWVGGK